MRHTCPECGRVQDVADNLVGRKVECPHCGASSFAGFSAERKVSPPSPVAPPPPQPPQAAPRPEPPVPAPTRKVAQRSADPVEFEPAVPPAHSHSPVRPEWAAILGPNRTCEWCARSIPENALKCPYCHEMPRHVQRDALTAITWIAAGWLLALVVWAIGLAVGWWREAGRFSDGSYNISPQLFSWDTFFSSASGLAVIAWLLASTVVGLFYLIRFINRSQGGPADRDALRPR